MPNKAPNFKILSTNSKLLELKKIKMSKIIQKKAPNFKLPSTNTDNFEFVDGILKLGALFGIFFRRL